MTKLGIPDPLAPGRVRLVLVEREIATDPREALLVVHSDLEMLVNVGGRERTTAEYSALLRSSRLRVARTIPLGSAAEAMGNQFLKAQLDG